jgi:hypothetical protein
VREGALLAAALLASTCGMAWLALAMKVHWSQVLRAASSPLTVQVLRVLGSVSLIGSLLLCLLANHPSIGVLVWAMSLAASALIVAFTLTWRAQWLAWLVPWARG